MSKSGRLWSNSDFEFTLGTESDLITIVLTHLEQVWGKIREASKPRFGILVGFRLPEIGTQVDKENG